MSKKAPEGLKTWRVIDHLGNTETIEGHYAFQNEDGSMTFRYKSPSTSYVVAMFAKGMWTSWVLIKNEEPVPEEKIRPSTPRPPTKPARSPFDRNCDEDIPF